MLSPRFAAFSELAVDRLGVGQDDAEAVAAFLQAQGRGARIDPVRVSKRTGVSSDWVAELLALGASPEGEVLERVIRLRCPRCGEFHDRGVLAEEIAAAGHAECGDCEAEIASLERLESTERYRLTEAADAEAVVVQAARRQMKVVFITALPLELEQIRAQISHDGKPIEDHTVSGGDRYYRSSFDGDYVDWEIYAGFAEATNVHAAASTATAILALQPDLVIFTGIAGGIRIRAKDGSTSGPELGDVVAADTVHDYEIGKESEDGYQPRVLQYRSSRALTQVAGALVIERIWTKRIIAANSDLRKSREPEAMIEPIAAGGKVVAASDSETFRLIRSTADRAVAVEMEGSGFLAAVHHFSGKVDGLLIRGISDLITDKGRSDAAGWQDQAAANASAFAFELLARYQPEPESPS